MKIKTVPSAAVERCPQRELSPGHYRVDSSCRCFPGVDVEVEDTYSDGHEASRHVTLLAPAEVTSEWWNEEVHPYTGDGHGLPENHGGDRTMEACSTATIVGAEDKALVGLNYEWVG